MLRLRLLCESTLGPTCIPDSVPPEISALFSSSTHYTPVSLGPFMADCLLALCPYTCNVHAGWLLSFLSAYSPGCPFSEGGQLVPFILSVFLVSIFLFHVLFCTKEDGHGLNIHKPTTVHLHKAEIKITM